MGGIAVATQAMPPIPTQLCVAWSLCRLSVTFVLSLPEPFDVFRPLLAGTLVRSESKNILCQMAVSGPQGKGKLGS